MGYDGMYWGAIHISFIVGNHDRYGMEWDYVLLYNRESDTVSGFVPKNDGSTMKQWQFQKRKRGL